MNKILSKIRVFYLYSKKTVYIKSFLKKVIYCTGSFFIRKGHIPKSDIKGIRNILLISLHYRGDLLFCTPIFEILKKILPDSSIDVWCKSRASEVLENNHNINEVLIFDSIRTSEYEGKIQFNFPGKYRFLKKLRRNKYDLVIDCTGLYRTALFTILANPKYSIGRNIQGFGFCYNKYVDMDFFNTPGKLVEKYTNVLKVGLGFSDNEWNEIIKYSPVKTFIYINDNNFLKIESELRRKEYNLNRPLICIHLTSGWDEKRWDLKNFEILIERLIKDFNYEVAIVGDTYDREENSRIMTSLEKSIPAKKLSQLFFQLSLIDSSVLIQKADVFIGSDSVPLHIAGAVDTPSIGLFGPTNPGFSNPSGNKHIVLYNELFCSAGLDNQYCTKNAGKTCKTLDCMKMITVDEVIEKLNDLLQRYKK